MKLSEMIEALQKLAKENLKCGDYNIEVYDEYTGNWHPLKIEMRSDELEIIINTED